MRLGLRIGSLCLVLATMALDQWSKAWALRTLAPPDPAERTIVPGLVSLRLVFNAGGLFGLDLGLSSRVVRVVSLGVSLALALFVFRLRSDALRLQAARVACALSLLLGGVLGNALDRLRNSAVVDFVHLQCGEVISLGTINFADIFIVTGALLLIPNLLGRDSASRKPSAGSYRAVENQP